MQNWKSHFFVPTSKNKAINTAAAVHFTHGAMLLSTLALAAAAAAGGTTSALAAGLCPGPRELNIYICTCRIKIWIRES